MESQSPNSDALIFVVDDDPGARVLARVALEQIGLRVEEAADGQEALRAFETLRPDLLLLDMVMPTMDGFATCSALRALPKGRDIPILVMTALDDVESLIRAYEAGATDFIGKPVRHVVLQHRVRYMLRARHTTRQLRVSQRRLARAQRIAGLAHWEWDSSDADVWLSDEFETVFGLRPEGIHDVNRLVHPEDRERVSQELRRAIERSVPVNLEHRILLPDGAERFVYFQAEPVGQGGTRWVGTLQDITERIELERQLVRADRLSALGQLAAGVAHEVNNPASFVLVNLSLTQEHLITIEAAIERLRCEQGPAGGEVCPSPRAFETILAEHDVDFRMTEIKSMLRENLAGMERIVGIVRDLGSFSRVDQDELEEVDLNEVVQAACNMTANEFRHHGRLIMDPGHCPTIVADRGKIAQVATNLLINAAHAIRDKRDIDNEIRVTTRHVDDHVVLSVEDTGCGVPGALRDRIFDPFFTTKPREQGLGVGLSLSADIVREHGGEIRLVRSSEAGSLFEVGLPVGAPTNTPATGPVTAPGPPAQPARLDQPLKLGGCRILVVDDEPPILSAYRRSLGRTHDVTIADGGGEALAILEQDADFDVVICDLMMPGLDGIALYEWVQEHRAQLTERIIFHTGGAFTPQVKAFVRAVDNPVLPKPIDWQRLACLIEGLATTRR